MAISQKRSSFVWLNFTSLQNAYFLNMFQRLTYYWHWLRDAVWYYYADDMPRMAAAMSFYLLMALPATLLLVTLGLDNVIQNQIVQEQIHHTLRRMFDANSSETILGIANNIRTHHYPNIWFSLLAVLSALVSATGASAQLQYSLNKIWGVKANPNWSNTLLHLLKSRILGIIFFVLIVLLAIVGLVASSLLNIFYDFIIQYISIGKYNLLYIANFGISYILYFFVFAIIYKYVPDVILRWRDVLPGALLTTFLFGIGRYLIGQYVAQLSAFSPYGVSSSLVVLLIWVFYSLQILFLGGEFIKASFLLQKKVVTPQWYASIVSK